MYLLRGTMTAPSLQRLSGPFQVASNTLCTHTVCRHNGNECSNATHRTTRQRYTMARMVSGASSPTNTWPTRRRPNVNIRQASYVHGSRHHCDEVPKPQTQTKHLKVLGLHYIGPLRHPAGRIRTPACEASCLFLGGAPREPPRASTLPSTHQRPTPVDPRKGEDVSSKVSDARSLSSHLGGECKRPPPIREA